MRLVAGALAIALFAPFARADETTPGAPVSPYDADSHAQPAPHGDAHGKVPLRVVRVMPESRQALLFDRSRSTHVLVELGGKIDGYSVDDIDDDTVTLVRDGRQVVLAAPPHGRERREHAGVRVRSAAPRASDDTTGPADAPADPYADPHGNAPVDPYGDAAVRVAVAPGAHPPASPASPELPSDPSIRVVHAPSAPSSAAPSITPGEGGVRVALAPGAPASPRAADATSTPIGGDASTGPIRVVQAPTRPATDAAAPAAAAAPADPYRDAATPAPASPAPASPAPAGAAPAIPAPAGAAPIRVVHAPTAAADAAASAPADPYGDAAPRAVDASSSPAPASAAPIRVVQAPTRPATDASAPADPYGDATPAGAAPIRVVHASTGPGPVSPHDDAVASAAASPARADAAAPANAGDATAPANAGDATSPAKAGDVRAAASPTTQPRAGATSPAKAGDVRAAASPTTQPRADATAPAKAGDVRAADTTRAPDRASVDARALADVMTDAPRARGRSPRTVSPDGVPKAAEVRTSAPDAHPADARPADARPIDVRPGDVVIPRAELDSALGNFAGLSASIRGSFSPQGLVVDSVGDGSLFQRAGLRAGDVITAVDGVRLRSLDDAANLYARASTAKAVTAQILRGGKPLTLRVIVP